MLRRAIVRRLLPHAAVWFILWPLGSTFAATLDLKGQSATALLPWSVTFGMLLRALPNLAPEWLWIAAGGCIVSVLVFSAAGGDGELADARPGAAAAARWTAIEPVLLMLAAAGGIATEYPAVLAHPLLRSLRPVPVLAALVIFAAASALLFLLFGFRTGGRRGAIRWGVVFLAAYGVSALAARLPAVRRGGAPSRRSIVLLGIDSLSQADDLSILHDLTTACGGAWFTRAVTPGLVTNAVWTSILQHRPVRETGVWTICMEADWRRAPFDLAAAAHRAGLRTRSFFSDQFTSYVGSEAGFDENASGPLGWIQLATASLKQNSVFLPVALPRLPHLPGARTPRNQSGTFAFDVSAELDDLLTGPDGVATFSAGHLDYLHQPLYPRFDELTAAERSRVLGSPVMAVEDLSFDWQYPTIPGDALGIYRWKVRHVQALVASALARDGFLDPARGNRVILFSDHGSRKDLTAATFDRPKYWNVLLAAFGGGPRDAEAPVSLLAIPGMLGLPDPSRAGPDPIEVDFVGIDASDLPRLAPYFLSDGRVLFDPAVIARMGSTLRTFRPFDAPGSPLTRPPHVAASEGEHPNTLSLGERMPRTRGR